MAPRIAARCDGPAVLDTKLRPPRTLGPVVPRRRLLTPLIAGEHPGRTVTAVSAPAGAGKTVLLTQWWRQLRESKVPVVWRSVEVLSKLADETRSFLLVTATPDRLTPDLARELSGRPDAGSVLDRLARDNVFVYREGSKRQSYHFHSPLRSYLRAEMQRRDASAAARVNTRAWLDGYERGSEHGRQTEYSDHLGR